MDKKKTGKIIRQARINKGYTQSELFMNWLVVGTLIVLGLTALSFIICAKTYDSLKKKQNA